MATLRLEWEYTYKSARRDGWSRKRAFRMFLRELAHPYWLYQIRSH